MTELYHLTTAALIRCIAPSVIVDGKPLKDVAQTPIKELLATPGVGKAQATRLKAAFELGRRYVTENTADGVRLDTPAMVADVMGPRLRLLDVEEFHVLLLNNSNVIIEDWTVSKGIVNQTIVHPREVFRRAVLRSAVSIILVHNHPSGAREASKEDIAITKQMIEAGTILNIKVLDHVIVCGDSYLSFSESGVMKFVG